MTTVYHSKTKETGIPPKPERLGFLPKELMKLRNRLKIASDIIRGKTIDSERIITERIDLNNGSIGIFGGLTEEGDNDGVFETVTVKELEDTNLHTLLPKIIKSDPAIDQIVSFFTTLVPQNHSVTAETSRGENAIQEILQMLEEKKNPLSLVVSHCASSLIMRGDICIETEFNESNKPENIWVPDPRWVEWRLISEKGNQRWALGNYNSNSSGRGSSSIWKEIVSPNVHYISGEPLIGERSSRSPLQTALFPALSQSAMIRTLQSILDVHAWAQTVFVVKKLELIKLESEGADIEDVNAQIKEAMALIKKLGKKRPDQVMGVTDDIEPMEMGGSGDKYLFTKDIGQLYDKRVAMGSKVPATIGGPAERSDYSTKEQGLFYSAYLQSSQERIRDAVEWAIKRFLRSMGVADDPIYTSKSINVQARMIESEAFLAVMTGIKAAVDAGMPLPLAIDIFEEEAGQKFSAKLKARIEKEYVKPADPVNDKPAQDPKMQDNNFIGISSAVMKRFRGEK